MSAMGDKKQEKKEQKRRVRERFTAKASWHDANSELVVRAIAAASSDGGALRFGYTRDGGAFCVGVYGDGEAYNLYSKPDDPAALNIMLQDIIDGFEGGQPTPVGKTK